MYVPNNGKERKLFFKNNLLFSDTIGDTNIPVVFCVNFNSTINKTLDRIPKHVIDDVGTLELKTLISRNNMEDIWRIRYPENSQYTFQRGSSQSRIDLILTSSIISSKIIKSEIKHCPFSDHNVIYTTIDMNKIKLGSGSWKMNLSTIKNIRFKNTLESFWKYWTTQKDTFESLSEWWDITKAKIRDLTIEVSKSLNKSKCHILNKIESQLQKLEQSRDLTNENTEQIQELKK